MSKIFGAILIAAIVGAVGATQTTRIKMHRWDKRIIEMCEKEGGAEIYEVITLTQEEFDAYGPIRGVIPIPAEAASHLYQLPYFNRRTTTVINENNPRVVRLESLILRKSDEREMASSVSFARISEDSRLGIRYDTGFSCANIESVTLDVSPQLFEIIGN